MVKRDLRVILKYHRANKSLHPENAHQVLSLNNPIGDEALLWSENGAFVGKLANGDVREVVQRNQQLFEPSSNKAVDV